MSTSIRPYTCEWEPAVKAFNTRLAPQAGPVTFQFPEHHVPEWLPPGEDRRVYAEYFLAVEDGTAVRGGYVLKTQDFWVDGRVLPVGNVQLPLSEGIVDPRYRFVGVQLVTDALRRQPFLYSLGMGSEDQPYPRLLKGLGWVLFSVPFYFRVIRPARFLRGMPYLRRGAGRRIACDLLALTGAGRVGIGLAQLLATRGAPRRDACRVELVEGFSGWADEVWETSRAAYDLAGVRDQESLTAIYAKSYVPRLIVLKMSRGGRPIGWAAMLDTPMTGHRYFGDLRVGSIVDGFGTPDDAPAVVAGAVEFLERRDVDLIVSNQAHRTWGLGLRAAGFLEGPSNFVFAMSRRLAEQVAPWGSRRWRFHLNRGDGDGPINL